MKLWVAGNIIQINQINENMNELINKYLDKQRYKSVMIYENIRRYLFLN